MVTESGERNLKAGRHTAQEPEQALLFTRFHHDERVPGADEEGQVSGAVHGREDIRTLRVVRTDWPGTLLYTRSEQ